MVDFILGMRLQDYNDILIVSLPRLHYGHLECALVTLSRTPTRVVRAV